MKPSMNGPLYGWLNDFSIIFQGISRCVFQRGYKVLLGSFKGVSEKSRRCFPSVSRNYSRPLKHVSRGSHGKIYYCRLVRLQVLLGNTCCKSIWVFQQDLWKQFKQITFWTDIEPNNTCSVCMFVYKFSSLMNYQLANVWW